MTHSIAQLTISASPVRGITFSALNIGVGVCVQLYFGWRAWEKKRVYFDEFWCCRNKSRSIGIVTWWGVYGHQYHLHTRTPRPQYPSHSLFKLNLDQMHRIASLHEHQLSEIVMWQTTFFCRHIFAVFTTHQNGQLGRITCHTGPERCMRVMWLVLSSSLSVWLNIIFNIVLNEYIYSRWNVFIPVGCNFHITGSLR